MELLELEEAIRRSWSKDTAQYPEEWTKANPALGQCAPTSLVVQDYMGGIILNAKVTLPDQMTYSHYFNFFDKKEYDGTVEQFPKGTDVPRGLPRSRNFPSTRRYLLSNEETTRRYMILKKRVEANLKYKNGDV